MGKPCSHRLEEARQRSALETPQDPSSNVAKQALGRVCEDNRGHQEGGTARSSPQSREANCPERLAGRGRCLGQLEALPRWQREGGWPSCSCRLEFGEVTALITALPLPVGAQPFSCLLFRGALHRQNIGQAWHSLCDLAKPCSCSK